MIKSRFIFSIVIIFLLSQITNTLPNSSNKDNQNYSFLETQDMSKSVIYVKQASQFLQEKLTPYVEKNNLETIINTFNKRPYVFIMILYYMFVAQKSVNFKFMSKFMIIGYFIALLAEYSSINPEISIPVFGRYYYIYENLQNELMLLGVPIWDSVSFVFMCFSGLAAARISYRNQLFKTNKQKLKLVIVSAAITTLFDIIVDPLAHQGQKWFLGKIYYYPEPGYYFDITYLNFQGWYIVSFVINFFAVFVFQFEENQNLSNQNQNKKPLSIYFNRFLCMTLIYGITAFNLVSYFIGLYEIFYVNLFYTFALTLFMFFQSNYKKNLKNE